MKIQQMTFMLIAVTLFFVLVGMFFLMITLSGLKESSQELCEKNAKLLVTKLANSPEFSCGEVFGSSRSNCIDADKVMALRNNIKDYSDFWGVSNIEIRKIYPKDFNRVCDQGNYPDCNLINVFSKQGGVSSDNFVSLCRKESFDGEIYDRCELAKIIIGSEYGEKC
ncbi:MAG: hypothetical protein ABH811_02745 [archaeon]